MINNKFPLRYSAVKIRMERQIILVVDDASENIDALYGILKDKYEVKAATDGVRALHIANAPEPPDVVLLDIMMPGMNGYDICRKLKANKKTREIPVIFLTVASETDSMIKGFELGGVDYIIKPFNPVELLTRLNTHLSLKAATEKLKNQNLILENIVENKTRQLRKKNDLLNESLKEKEALLHEALEMDVKLRESLDMLNRLYVRIQVIQEEERKKIALEIHDRLGQILTAIKLNLYQIQNKAGGADEKFSEKIASALSLADDAIKAAQSVSMHLRPDILDNLGFLEAVKWYCRTMTESSGVAFGLEVRGTAVTLEKATELCVYRVIQEAFTNVVRHSNAKTCAVEITGLSDFLKISIRDDGVGIDKDKIGDVDSLGIYGMKKRMDDIHGDFRIEGACGEGTTVTLLIPLKGAPRD
jgi:signal transduction histidine kinase